MSKLDRILLLAVVALWPIVLGAAAVDYAMHSLVGYGITPYICSFSVNGTLNPQAYGARGDAIYSGDGVRYPIRGVTTGPGSVADGVTTSGSTTFTAGSGNFTAALVGDTAVIEAAGASGAPYVGTVATYVNATTLTLNPAPATSLTTARYTIGYDNSAAFTAVVAAAGSQGPIEFPPGNYMWNNSAALHFTGANCNVNVRGSARGGVTLIPNFSGDAISFAYNNAADPNPAMCDGGVEHISFIGSWADLTNLNLIHLSNVEGITLAHISAGVHQALFNLGGANDTTIYIDVGPLAGQFTEMTKMIDINSWFVWNMLTLDGKGKANGSLNNTSLVDSHCDPAGTGSCINMINWAGGGVLTGSNFQFNADLNNPGESLIFTNHRAGDVWGDSTWNINAQYPDTNPAHVVNCFNAPAGTGPWVILGSVYCATQVGNITAEAHGNAIEWVTTQMHVQPNVWRIRGSHSGMTSDGHPPTLSACGTNPSLSAAASDSAGEIVFGTGTITSCHVTFGTPWLNNVACSVVDDGQPIWYFVSSKGPTGFTIMGGNCPGGNCQGESITYDCIGFGGT